LIVVLTDVNAVQDFVINPDGGLTPINAIYAGPEPTAIEFVS